MDIVYFHHCSNDSHSLHICMCDTYLWPGMTQKHFTLSKSQGPCLESESSYYATRSLEVKMEIKGVKAFYT